jgi:hypothetical protein
MNYPLHLGGEWVSAQAGYSLSDEHSELEPPDPISNSEVKRLSADGSVGFPHVRVGHRQAYIRKPRLIESGLFFAQNKAKSWIKRAKG